MKNPNSRIYFDMCDEGAGCYTPTYYRHKDGGVYEFIGFCSTYVDGVTLNLVAYRPKGDVTRYVRTVEHFHNSFKQINPEYEYQWLIRNKKTKEFNPSLAFYGEYETEEYALERLKKEAFEYLIDWQDYDLVKIEETKRLRNV